MPKLVTVASILALILGIAPNAHSSGDADRGVQLWHEINNARWAPSSVATMPSSDLPLPRPPLAWNDSLASAAGFHAEEMVEHGYVAHRSPVTGIWPNRLARDFGYPLPASFPDGSNGIESIQAGAYSAAHAMSYLASSTAHRYHLLGVGGYGAYTEAGVGWAPGVWVVQSARRDDQRAYLTGIVFRDLNANSRLDPGEGLAGVDVVTGVGSAVTATGGVFSIALPRGRHTVSVSGGGFEGTASAKVKMRDVNVGIEFLSGSPTGIVRDYQLCGGREPTILGTSAGEVIYGTEGDDVIHALGGNDTVYGLGGADLICGGDGRDRLYGGRGSDDLRGGSGRDRINGNASSDVIDGGSGADRLNGGIGSDVVNGGPGAPDRVSGGGATDSCSGEIVFSCEN